MRYCATLAMERTYTMVRRRPMYWLTKPAMAPPLHVDEH